MHFKPPAVDSRTQLVTVLPAAARRAPARRAMTTLVNVREIQAVSRSCRRTAQKMHADGEVRVVPDKSLDELISQRFMEIVPRA